MVTTDELVRPLPWSTVPELLRRRATEHPDRELLRCPDRVLSFAETAHLTAHLAGRLQDLGVDVGDRVGIMLPNTSAWPLLWLAVLHAGAVAVPINCAYAEADLRHVIEDSGLVLVVTDPQRRDLVASVGARTHLAEELEGAAGGPGELRAAGAGMLANLQYTSGTTGFPKACMLTHDDWLRLGRSAAAYAGLGDDDVALTAQPFSYIDPLWNVAMCLVAGIPLVVLARFSASGLWASAREHGATTFYVLGTMPQLLHRQPPHPEDRHHRMRLVLCSGIPAHLHAELEQRWGVPWRETYGLTESGLNLIAELADVDTVGSGTIGRPAVGQEVAIVDPDLRPLAPGEVGEIVIRSEGLMRGYWNRPEATAEAFRGGWFHTGDLGTVDADGWFRIVGRLKDMVRRGGENIAAAEVEAVLNGHPGVLAGAVVAVPDELFGEEVKAYLRVEGADHHDLDLITSVLDLAAARLARFKVPRYVELVDTLPMTPSQRVAKAQLKAVSGATWDRVQQRWA